jgi:hypothetical protein
MSSKLLRGDAAPKSAAWRPPLRTGVAPQAGAKPSAQAPDSPVESQQQREIDARVKAAYQQGFTAAETVAAQKTAQRVDR